MFPIIQFIKDFFLLFSELDTLSENFESLFCNKDSCDTTLNVQDKEYKAHRAVLIARSSVFAAMFQHETTEKLKGIINIPDCDPESFDEFLKFLYTGKLEEPSCRSALDLYEISDKYDVQELKAFCVEFLMENLTVENLCDIAVFADKYEETNLLSAAEVFFSENVNAIFETLDWDFLVQNNYRLSKKLMREVLSKVKPLC